MPYPLAWTDRSIRAVDQRRLPHDLVWLTMHEVDDVIEAITTLAVRGAPTLGIAGALGTALSAHRRTVDGVLDRAGVEQDASRLAAARPTAVNLSVGVGRALGRLDGGADAVLDEALAMLAEDEQVNGRAARRAADLLVARCPQRPLRILTHCNTGSLATAGGGTALGAITELASRGLVESVLVDETRPLLQGSRLTTWELDRLGIAYRLCVDSAAAAAMAGGLVDCVVVGADRIVANGDVANKIGTYALAVAARHHGIPFVVVAPESTIDDGLAGGQDIAIECRGAEEVTTIGGVAVAAAGTPVWNPAFDVTPAELITAVVTDERVLDSSSPARALGATCRSVHARGWMPATAGNLSVRVADDALLITASGVDKGSLTAADVVQVALDGVTHTPGGRRPSAETAIHAAIYRSTDARAVVHAHPPYATAVAALVGAPDATRTLPIGDYELLKAFGRGPGPVDVPVFANLVDVAAIAGNVEQWLSGVDDVPALLIERHGVTTWGADLDEALVRLECIEALCHLLLLTGDVPTSHPTPGVLR